MSGLETVRPRDAAQAALRFSSQRENILHANQKFYEHFLVVNAKLGDLSAKERELILLLSERLDEKYKARYKVKLGFGDDEAFAHIDRCSATSWRFKLPHKNASYRSAGSLAQALTAFYRAEFWVDATSMWVCELGEEPELVKGWNRHAVRTEPDMVVVAPTCEEVEELVVLSKWAELLEMA